MYPTENDEELRARVARHIGATEVLPDGRMRCPSCGGLDFGPTLSMYSLRFYTDDYLPGGPLLVGVCMDCEHTVVPSREGGLS